MSENQEKCRLYLITPPKFKLAVFAENLKQAFDGGDVACVQLRMKEAKDDEVLRAAEILMPICHDREAVFIINDRPDLAKAVGADGVHLGMDDCSVSEARRILGNYASIGVSCYGSKDRAMVAGEEGADYVAFGQFYETKTKPPRGRPTPEILEWWSTFTTVPCVAIGGIKPENCAPLVKAGADFIAVVTGVWEHPKGPKESISEYNKAINLAYNQRNC